MNKKARLRKNGSSIVQNGFWTYEEIEKEKIDKLINNYFDFERNCSTIHNPEFRNSPFIKDI
jgi:hypothetical protein